MIKLNFSYQMSQEKLFIEFLEDYKNLIFKVSNIYCRLEEDRKDLIQEIILQLWKAFPKYDPTFARSTWTYRIALNVSISYVRKTSTRNRAIQGYKSNVNLIQIEEEDINEQLTELYDAIQFLKPLDKAIISLSLEGCKNKEIAKVLGITPSNVSTKLNRIKEKLKNHFTKKNIKDEY